MSLPQQAAPQQAARNQHAQAAVRNVSLSLLLGILAVLALAIVFVKLTDEVTDGPITLDRTVALAVHSTASPTQTSLMLILTNFGQIYLIGLVVVSLIIGAIIVFRARRDKEYGLPVAIMDMVAPTVALAGALGLAELIKLLVGRMRPHIFPPLTHESGFSFPSGHTIASLTFYGMCAFLLARPLHRWARLGVVLAAAVVIGTVAYSRIYLGVHYPTDVLGSFILGAAWLLSVILTLTTLEHHLAAMHQLQQGQTQASQEIAPKIPANP